MRIDNATGALTFIYTFAPGTITSATALAVDLNGDIYFTDSQVAGAKLLKFVPNPPPATGGTLSTVGTLNATFIDANNAARNLVFGKLAFTTSGSLFTIANYSPANASNLPSRPYMVNLNKATAAVVSTSIIPAPSGVTDLPVGGGDIDFSPAGRLFVGGTTTSNIPSIWEISPANGSILGYKSVPVIAPATYYNLAGIGFDLQGNLLTAAPISGSTATYMVRISASEFSGTNAWSGNSSIPASSVTVLSGPISLLYGDLGSNSFKISGRVFEDVNYGGGAGRTFGAGGTAGIPNARVEVYNAAGNMENFTNTQADGTYAIGVSGNGVFYIRVVNSTVKSTRPGSNGTELGVQTFRAERVVASTLNNVVDEVGGRSPATADPGTGTIGTTALNTTTFVLSGGISGAAQSVSQASIGTSSITGIDFGFNFSTIVNTNNTGQGSLQQFINNSNILANTGLSQAANSIFTPAPGVETSIFMIPDGNAHPGINKPNQLTAAGGGATAIINLTSLLPAVTDANTSIDGRTQTANIGNTQPGVAGNPGTKVGVDQVSLPGIQQPEVEIRWNGAAGAAASGLNLSGNNEIVRSIAISRFGNNTSAGANILSTGNNNLITENIIGGAAVSTNTEAAGTNPGTNISISGNAGTITNNYIIRADFGGIRQRAAINGLTISGNEILNNGNGAPASVQPSGIGIEMTSGTVSTDLQGLSITGNSIQNSLNEGLKVAIGSGTTVTNNTFSGNGAAGTIAAEKDNIQFNNTTNSVITRNIITAGGASGIAIGGGAAAVGNKITQNSTFANAGLGIDLRPTGSAPDIVTPNGNSNTGPNTLLNFPVITGAAVIGNNLVVKGYSPPGANIELFLADRDASFAPTPPLSPNPLPAAFTALQGFGEGRRYLATFQEGGTVAGITDQDAATGTYMDDGTGTIGTRTGNRFQFTIPLSALSGVAQGSLLTATATDAGNNTSEFNGVVAVAEADFGDAPDSYSTLSTSGGPAHLVNPQLKIGATVAGKPEALAVAAGADANAPNGDPNDDGLTASLPVLTAATTTYSLTFPVTNTTGAVANLEGWIDFNRNGTFDPGEAAGTTVANNGTTATLTWSNVNTLISGAGTSGGMTYARIRLTTDPLTATSTVGFAMDGEVEDYSLIIQQACDLSITKTANPNPVTAGQPLTYTLTVTNNGPSAINTSDSITVTDNLPAGYTANSYTASAGTYTSGNGIWTGLALLSGQSATITITGTVAANVTDSLNNTAIVTNPPTITDPNLSNDTVRQTTTIHRVIDYGLTKTSSPKPAAAGQALTYTITLTNNGPSSMLPGDTLTLTDNLPSGFTANNYAPSAGTYNSATGAWTGLSLATGGSATLTITGTVSNSYTGTSLINTVTLTPPTGTTDPTPPTAKDTTPVSRVMDLDLAKTATPKPAVAGQALTYTITLTNNGPATLLPADIVTVTDNLPSGFTAGSYTPSAGSYTSGTGAWTGLTLATGQSATLTIAGTVSAGISGTALINTVTATPPAGVTDPTLPTAKDTTRISRKADLSVTKTANPNPVVAGQPLTYTLTVTNNGPSAINASDSITVTDNLPAGYTANSYTASAGTYTSGNGIWTGLVLASGQSATITIAGDVAANAAGSLNNTAIVSNPPTITDPNLSNDTARQTTTIHRVIDYGLTKTSSPKPATVGQALTYTITLTNNGPSSMLPGDTLTLTDNLPSGFTANNYAPSAGTYNSATGAWTGLSLATGGSATLTITGTVGNSYTGTSLINTVTLTPPTGTTDPTPPTAKDTTPVSRVMDLELAKTATPKPAVAGQALTYTITLTNNGPATLLPADIVTVTDNLPSGFTAGSYTPSAGSYTSETGAWTGLTLATGQSATLTIAGTVSAGISGTALINTVTATPPPGTTDPTPPTAHDTTVISRVADLTITKTDGSATYTPGTDVVYTIVVRNNGVSDVIGATVSDMLPAGITAATWSASTLNGATVPATNGTGAINQPVNIPAGGSITYKLTLKVPAGFTGNLSNTATVTPPAGYTDNNTTNNTVTDTDTYGPQFNLKATKAGTPDAPAGTAISYTITYVNSGPSDAIGVILKDSISTQITDVTWTASVQGSATVSAASGSGDVNLTGNLPAGSGNTITITVNGTIKSSATGTILNTASVTPPGSTTPIPSNTVSTTVKNQTGLNIMKTGPASGSVSAGDTIMYTIQVTNAGPSDAPNANIQDNLPATLTGASWTATATGTANITGGSPLNGTGNINIAASLPAGSGNGVTIVIKGRIPSATPAGTITNTASATPAGGTPVTSQVTTSITNDPALVITKHGPATLNAGDSITYTIEVINNGSSDAAGAVITDNIPAQIQGARWTATATGTAAVTAGSTGTSGNVSVTANIPAGTGNKITIVVTGKVDPAVTGTLTNTAAVTPAGKPSQPSNTVSTVVGRKTSLQLVKSGPATISAGQNITYTLVLTNAGPSDAIDVQITDALDSHILNPVISASSVSGKASIANATISNNTLSVTGNVAGGAGNSITIMVAGKIDPAFAGSITNTATAEQPDGPAVPSQPVTTVVANTPDVTISKSGPSSTSGGNGIEYTIVVGNNGPSDAMGVAITDSIPSGISGVKWTVATSGNGTTSSASSGSGNVNITGNIPAGAANKITITVTGIVDPAFSGSIVNKAAATVPGKPPVTANVTTNVTNDPNVQITKSGPPALSAGQDITYTITVTNNGPSDAIGATIADAIPAGVLHPTWSVVTAGTGTTVNTVNGAGNINIAGNIPAGAGNSITITVKGQVDPAYTGGALNNFSQITVPGKPTVSSDTVTTTITNDPVLHITKTGPDKASAGTQITYQLLITNTGPSNATGVAITDILPSNLLYASWTAVANGTGTSVSAAAGTGNVNITGNIPAGAANNISITIRGTVDSSFSGTITNTATAGVTGKTPVSASKATAVTNDPNVVIVKSGPATISAGQPVVYTLDVTNSGPSNAVNVAISDNLPAGLQQVSWTATVTGVGTTVSATSGNGDIAVTGNIPAGAANKITFTINAVVDPAYTSASIANSATAAVPGKTPSVSTVTTQVANITDLNIVKSGPQQAVAGQHVTYTIVVTNAGPANATGSHIVDAIPAGLQNVTWTATANGAGTSVSAATGTGNVDITANIPAGTGNNVTIVVNGKADPATTVTTLKNTATATPPPGATDPTPATSTVTTSVDRKADLVIVKTGPADKAAGQPISYQLLIINNGPSDVPGAVIRDAVPAEISNITFTATASGTSQVVTTDLTGNNLTVTGNITAGAGNSITVNINGVVNAGATPGTISNTATVTPPAGITETVPGTNSSTINTKINTDAGLQISKSGPAEVNVGDKIVYKVIVSNTGTSNIAPVNITDLVPAAITDVTWTATATGNGGTTVSATSGSGNNINLQAAIEGTTDGPGEILITITGTISPAAGSSIVNTATATSAAIKASSLTTSVNKSADLNIIKTGPANINAGQQISYTLEVTNGGPADVTGATITDNIPAGISNVTWNAAVSGGATVNTASGTGSAINITAGMPAGTGKVVVTVTGTVDAAFSGTLTNIATATPPAGVIDPTPATSTVSTIVNTQTGLQVIKSGPAAIAAGNQITYSITVVNNGPSDAMNLSIDDVVPAAVQNVKWTAASAGSGVVLTGGTGSGNTVHVTGNLPAGTGNKIEISVTGTVSPSFSGALVNTATATPKGGTTVTGPPVTTNVVNQAALQVTKSGPATVFAGAPVTYTIDIVNNGPSDAGNISITDAVPSQIQQVTWTATATGTGTSVSQNSGTGNNISLTGNIAAGTGNKISITVSGIVAPSFTGVITNTASAALPGGTPATSSVNTTISNQHGLSVVKSGPSNVVAGQVIVYTVVVTNAGPSDAINTNITDLVPAQVQKVTWTAAATGTNTTITGSNSGSGNDIQLLANIPAGAGNKITITINGVVDPTFTGAITNTATAVPTGGTPVNSIPVITQVTNRPGLHITKVAPSDAQAGDDVTYVVKVTNAGPSDAISAAITDNVPAGINNVTWTATASGNATVTAGAAGSGTAVAVTGNIAAGAGNEIVVNIHGKLDPHFSGKLKNVAKVSAPGNPQVTTDTTVTNVQRKANVLITKSGPAQLAAGSDITYTIDVTNNGPSDLDTLKVTDVVPSLVTVKSWQAVRVSGNVTFTGPASGTGNNISIQAAATSGSQLRITITGTLQQTTATTVTNTAHIKVPPSVVTTTPDSSMVITKIVQQPGVTLQKTGPTITRTGDQVIYHITAGNNGPSDATAIVITDTVPAALKNVSWTTAVVGSGSVTAGNSGTGNNISVTANIGAGTGNRILITVTGTVPADYGGQLVNTATANVPGQPVVVTPPVITTVSKVADLKITKTGPATLVQGSAISYVVTVTNAGPSDANGATFSDAVPAGVTGVTATVQSQSNGAAGTVVSANGGNVTGTIATLPANGSISILISGTAATIGTLSNTATVNPPSGVTDNVPDNNTTPPVITTVVAKPRLHITKTVTPGPYKAGDKVTYTLTVSNSGVITVKDVVVTDVLTGDNLPTPVFGKPGLGTVSYNAASHTAVWSIDSLESGQSTTLTYDMVLLDQGAIGNTAIVAGPPATSVPDTAKVDINPVRSADLVVNKIVVTPQPYVIAKRIGYKIEVSNHGPNAATGVVVTDVLPAALGVPVDITVTKGAAHYDPARRSIIWTIGDVSTTDALTLTYTVQIISGGSIPNTATVQGNENDPAPGSNTSVVTITASDEIFIPNVITPNGDGKNDRFVILGLGKYPGSGLFIYNRWGNMVYQSKDYDNKWDGNGLNEGTYYYILKLRAPEGERVYKGWIELLR